jgi:hypothetical protein
MQQSPFSIAPAPLNKKGESISSKEFNNLIKTEQDKIIKTQEILKDEIKSIIRKSRKIKKEANEALKNWIVK